MNYQQLASVYPERICATASGQVSYREAGSGTAVVLLHGISSGAVSWLGQLAGLKDHRRVIAWNAPGYAATTPLAMGTPSAADYATVLADFVDAMQLERFVLVGHSLGALMATAYAQAHAERLAGLVLLSPARGYGEASQHERDSKLTGRLQRLDTLGLDGMARERATALVSSTAAAPVVAWIGATMRGLNVAGYRQAARMLADDDIGRYAANLDLGVAVRSGDADNITPVAKCQAIADMFAHASYASLAGLGHAFYLEACVQTNQLLTALVTAAIRREQ